MVLDPKKTEGDLEAKYVFVRLAGQLFGIPARQVSEMIQVPKLTPLPKREPFMRGVFVLRGESVAALDLRTLMGFETIDAETDTFRDMLRAREEDHRNWLVELERSVVEERAFTLAIDPHKCAFGRWYDTFETKSVLIQSHLTKFDKPHRRIHAVATEVRGLVEGGDSERALERIDQTRSRELGEMIALFQQFHDLLDSTTREIAVVLNGLRGERLAYCVDVVEGVQDVDLASGSADAPPSVHPALRGRGLTPTFVGPSREVALLIDEERLLGHMLTA